MFIHTLSLVVDCDAPPVLLNGYTLEFNTTYNSIVTYRCNSSYVFSEASSENRTCLLSGHWSDETITCCEFIGTPTTCSPISIELLNSPIWVEQSFPLVLLTWTRLRDYITTSLPLGPLYSFSQATYIAYTFPREHCRSFLCDISSLLCVWWFVCLVCISLEDFLSSWDASASLLYL